MEVIDTIDQIIDEIVDTTVSEYKDCTKCGISKLKNCFSKNKASEDGLCYYCKDCARKRYQENRDEILAQKAEYDAKPETKAKTNSRLTKRRNTDEGYRKLTNLRARLTIAMKGKKKSASTMKLVGLESGTAINDYLNLKSPWFKEQSVPSEELATDHIIPCEKYDLTIPDHQKACFHYINLQLLTELENKRKGDKVPDGFDFESTLQKQLDLIARIEKDKLTYQQVLEKQKAGELYEVKGYEV